MDIISSTEKKDGRMLRVIVSLSSITTDERVKCYWAIIRLYIKVEPNTIIKQRKSLTKNYWRYFEIIRYNFDLSIFYEFLKPVVLTLVLKSDRINPSRDEAGTSFYKLTVFIAVSDRRAFYWQNTFNSQLINSMRLLQNKSVDFLNAFYGAFYFVSTIILLCLSFTRTRIFNLQVSHII